MKAVKIKEDIYWVGAIDYKLRNFHGYSTEKGSSYNAYLIIDKDITLIDTVKLPFKDELIQRISSVVDLKKIKNIILNHAELDHSGSVEEICRLCPDATVYASFPSGVKNVGLHFPALNIHPLKSGETMKLGKRTLQFVATPMVHWPDNMLTYCPEEKILFSNDAFGQHLACAERFDDQLDKRLIFDAAKKYYANIVLPYSPQVAKALLSLAGIPIEVIAPSHGILFRKEVKDIIAAYTEFCSGKPDKRAVIVYDTMWGSTEKMAKAIGEGFLSGGVGTEIFDLQNNHISDVLTSIMGAEYLAVGSPTLNNGILATVAGFLCYLKGLAPKGIKALSFGSYGWGGQSTAVINDALSASGIELLNEGFKQLFIPSDENLASIENTVYQLSKI